MKAQEKVRINKYLSEIGICSRREADRLIERKKIIINGEIAQMGEKVSKEDEIQVNGEKIFSPKNNKRIYIAFNKPSGIVCTTDTKREKDNIIDFINYPKRIFPIGRLDKPSEGLIFLSRPYDIRSKALLKTTRLGKFLIFLRG